MTGATFSFASRTTVKYVPDVAIEFRRVNEQMKLNTLLGKKLKDDEIIEILESYDIGVVVYDFDRSHENMDDVYWAKSEESGFQFRFDKDQVLDVIFCYVAAGEGFTPIDTAIIGVPIYKTFGEAERVCTENALRYSVPNPSFGAKYHKAWLRVEESSQWSHYQFEDGKLFLVTLSLPEG